MKTLAALAVLTAGLAPASSPLDRQQAQLDRACHETVASVRRVLGEAATTQVQTIVSHLTVVTPGRLTGEIAFNPAGTNIRLAGERVSGRAAASEFGCGEATGTVHGIGRGHSQVVASLRRRFAKRGQHALTFRLRPAGRRILARLAAAERAFGRHHRRGAIPPTIAFGIQLVYAPAG